MKRINIQEKMLVYWRNSLADTDRKKVQITLNSIFINNYVLDQVSKKQINKLWESSKVFGDEKINEEYVKVDISPCSIAPEFKHGKTEKLENETLHPFWIPAKMHKDGKLTPLDKPFFVRDYLSPNPVPFYTISSIQKVDNCLQEFEFCAETWQQHWIDCENFFKKITGKGYKEFDSKSEGGIHIQNGVTRNTSKNILTLFNHLIKGGTNTSLLDKLVGITSIKKRVDLSKQKYSFYTKHLGQMNNSFPLSGSQRESMSGYTISGSGDILAVNGPPGTGKTTLLQSIVANSIVQSVYENKAPELIVASSTNNQAITNILDSFKFDSKKNISETISDRWLPEVNSLGLYLSSKNKSKYQLMTSPFGDGFIKDFEGADIEPKLEYFRKKYSKHFTSENSIVKCKKKLQSEVKYKVDKIKESIKIAQKFEDIQKSLQNGVIKKLEDEIAQIELLINNEDALKERIEEGERKLLEANSKLGLFDKLFYFLPRARQRKESAFKRALLDVNFDSKTNFSNFDVLKQDINNLIVELSFKKKEFEKDKKASENKREELKSIVDKYQNTIDTWDNKYGEQLIKLHADTGGEYKNLNPLEDMSVRLDISWRFEAFWMSIHYREAEYLLLLQEKLEKYPLNVERGENSYKRKLNRIACLTPVFISTFHSLPKYAIYFNGKETPIFNLFDLLIVDEAGQVASDVSVPSFALAKKAIVVGDVNQIEPVWSVEESVDKINLLENNLITSEKLEEGFDDLKNKGVLCSSGNLMLMAQKACVFVSGSTQGTLLREHRRCLDSIISYSNKYVYNNQLRPKVGDKHFQKHNIPSKGFLHINSESKKVGSSKINEIEAVVIAKWIDEKCLELEKDYKDDIHRIIAVITPFKSQSLLIKEKLRVLNFKKYDKIITGTVHALQGAEMKIVIFSTVLSKDDNTSFISKKYNMLNVAVSRAKHSFLLFGNMKVLDASKNDPLGNLKKWLSEEVNCELSNKLVYETDFINPDGVKRISKLKEHVGTLRRAFEISKKEIVIVSPFISIQAIENDSIIGLAKDAINRGVKVIVVTDSELDKIDGKLKVNSAKGRELLSLNGIDLKKNKGIHNKTLMVDDKILVEGSFNWLSAVRDINSPYFRLETSIVIQGKEAKKHIMGVKKDMQLLGN